MTARCYVDIDRKTFELVKGDNSLYISLNYGPWSWGVPFFCPRTLVFRADCDVSRVPVPLPRPQPRELVLGPDCEVSTVPLPRPAHGLVRDLHVLGGVVPVDTVERGPVVAVNVLPTTKEASVGGTIVLVVNLLGLGDVVNVNGRVVLGKQPLSIDADVPLMVGILVLARGSIHMLCSTQQALTIHPASSGCRCITPDPFLERTLKEMNDSRYLTTRNIMCNFLVVIRIQNVR